MRINITRSEFQKSFRNHYMLYKNTAKDLSPRTRRLLLFYSVECGLKGLIMKNTGASTYEQLKEYSEQNNKQVHGHNLKEMTKEVDIESDYPLKKIRLAKTGGDVRPAQYNELWRYGAAVEDEEEELREEKTLQSLAEWIKDRI